MQQITSNAEVDERLAALMTNVNAIRSIAAAVAGTIGPKGLDTMLVDRFGSVVITNAGVTILDLMEVNHPAARMLINVAKAQHEAIGDGTTTATLLAGSLVASGVDQVIKGVPVPRVIEGLRLGIAAAILFFKEQARLVQDLADPVLRQVAMIAGREHQDIADLVVQAAGMIGMEKLQDENFKLRDTITAAVGAENSVFLGTIVGKERMSREMPDRLTDVQVLVIDDALEAETIEDEALATESGVNRYLELRREFAGNLQKIIDMGVGLVLVDRGIDDLAEEMFADAGIIAVQRVSSRELRRAAEHTGARVIKRTGLKKSPAELVKYLGRAAAVFEDEKLEQVRIIQGGGKPMATIQVGAATEEVVGERERIAKDAAAAVQIAVRGGVLPGGGAAELAAVHRVEGIRRQARGMAVYGTDCVLEALKKPFMQIVLNAGFNPLEKLGDVLAAQAAGNFALSVDCESGEIVDMTAIGVFDPALVKIHALQAAGEVAEAILRIDTIIKMKAEDVLATE